jgi:mono/diheme cytochrome c family protein
MMCLTRCCTLLELALLAALGTGPAYAEQPAAAPRDPAQVFATTCGWCHHKGGREAGKGPQLMGTTLTDAQIEYRIKHGRQGFMPGFEGTFSQEEIKGLVSYIRSLKPG